MLATSPAARTQLLLVSGFLNATVPHPVISQSLLRARRHPALPQAGVALGRYILKGYTGILLYNSTCDVL